MNKKGLIGFAVLAVFIACISNVLAISSDIKASYQPEETLILKISGNILAPIASGNVEFKRGYVAVPVEYDLKKIGDNYYLWAVAPASGNNYTLIVKDISTTVSGKSALVNYEANFSVAGNATDYYVKPGFVYALNNFDINVWLNDDLDKGINTKFIDSKEVTLKPGNNKISFSIEDVEETGGYKLVIGKYTLPVYVVKGIGTTPIQSSLPNLRFKPRIIESTLLEGKGADYPFYIINSGGQDIKNIEFVYDKSLFTLSPETNVNISSGETETFVISLKEPASKDINALLVAKGDGFSINMSVDIKVTSDESKTSTPYLEGNYSESEQYYCYELNGSVCGVKERCSVAETTTSGGEKCCLGGLCVENRGGSFTSILIGIVILLVVGGVLFFIWRKYKTLKPSQDIIAEKIKQIEKK